MANKGTNVDDIELSGLYLWQKAFAEYGDGGVIDTLWRGEDLEDYDIIHINYTPSNIQLPTVVRQELGNSSSTKMVINMDLDVARLSPNWAYHLTNMVNEMRMADNLFHVEPEGAKILGHLLDKKVTVNPHPVDVTRLYDYIRNEREPMIGTIYHRYTADTLTQYIAQKDIALRKVLFGYNAGKHHYVANQGMYDDIIPYTNFKDYIGEISKSFIGCDLFNGFAFGRVPIEFAALGIPAVVSNTIGAAKRLFPYTSVDPFDVVGAGKIFERLTTDPDFADKVILHAHSNCGYYSLQSAHARFMEMIEN
ncbi:hypothetical protein E4H12_09505 [Candidatus Thorarchaeota archaeon]|nr:MAG: hypothetical protein E4H12_09505 [Candidatus Thorarchaeota archaeon]